MKIKKIYDITFDTNETRMTATLSKSNEVVMLMSSGNVIRYNLDDKKDDHLLSINSEIEYSGGGFDITAKTSIYTLNEIVVVVNDYKTHGYIHYPGKYNSLPIWRENYHADISTYPIALYKDSSQVPHLIYGKDWNHVQIMNLDNQEILTASKSLFKEIEESEIEFYKEYYGCNKLPELRTFDYFFGKLKVSPDNKYFLSEGWDWGSSDSFSIFDIKNFLENDKIAVLRVGRWEHLNRASCWIDSKTVAFAYNPFAEDDNRIDYKIGSEIHFSNFTDKKSENIVIKSEGIDTISSKMEYSKQLNSIIVISGEIGVTAISLTGEILFQDNDFKAHDYFPDINLFLTIHDKRIIINTLLQ